MQELVYFIEGDGTGPEIWAAAKPVLDAAVEKSYGQDRRIEWRELLAGEKALAETGELLPKETLTSLQNAKLAIKGPLSTPVGGGFRSLNVTLRQVLDLYACIRPVKHYQGIESPVKHPERVDMVIFRENTEDLYTGIEFAADTPESRKLIKFLRDEMGVNLSENMALGIKPMSKNGSQRLIRKAIQYALDKKRDSVALMHKGNIMKYTEGAFREWGYELAAEEFADSCVAEKDLPAGTLKEAGKVIIKDRIADYLFQAVLTRASEFSVIAAPNLNGDYISDALAAQVGGLGIAPGVNMSDSLAFFEATHGTAPKMAGKNSANPSSVILSGAMLLEHLGWDEAAGRIHQAMNTVLAGRKVTTDLARLMDNATTVGCKEFGELLGAAL
ncbi:MAG: NADP-dependent isocitrate dehydrogenase [Deltaproteobacteria bacterium]|jgi:isocitrate dehydrogenase|nr:NADP-dependent isocitrate dehydrogenase [Deltaproteobacteria bacterium]